VPIEKVETQVSHILHHEVAEPTSTVAEPEAPQIKKEPVAKVVEVVVPSKKLLVIYKFEESEPLPVPLKKLMLKIIGAVGIDVMQGVYVNHCFKELPSTLTDFENILVFSSAADLNLEGYQQTAQYEAQIFGSTRVLVSDELPLLDQQVPLKRKLWGVLQQMFPKN
jgi:hypothetical protein